MVALDFDTINDAVTGNLATFLQAHLPGGRFEGKDYTAANPTRADKKLGSFRINRNTCQWTDHATGDKGKDAISLYAYIKGIGQYESAKELAELYLHQTTAFKPASPQPHEPQKERVKREAKTHIAKQLWQQSTYNLDKLGDYLLSRDIELTPPETIRFLPRCRYPSGLYFPAMISLMSVYGSKSLAGVHRTYLNHDCNGKADIKPNKAVLGSLKGAAVRLAPLNKSGVLILCEGIETGLSFMELTNSQLPVWCALSANNIDKVILPEPERIKEIVIATDNDDAGFEAAYRAEETYKEKGYNIQSVRPKSGKDYNDYLSLTYKERFTSEAFNNSIIVRNQPDNPKTKTTQSKEA